MLKRIRERMNRDEGFTLIELMVVVLIIAILIAIAIPTFLGARERAQDRAAQSSLRNALTAAKTIFTDNEDYADATVTELQASEPSLTFVDGATDSDDQNTVSVDSSDPDGIGNDHLFGAAALSNSGKCFFIRDNTRGPGTQFGVDESDTAPDNCDGATALGSADQDSW